MRQTILTIFLVLVLAASGYAWLRYARTAVPAERPAAASATAERLAQYRHLKNLTPDTSIFIDPLFRSLQLIGPAVGATSTLSGGNFKAGRTNPFHPF